jgi:hypothetical protein
MKMNKFALLLGKLAADTSTPPGLNTRGLSTQNPTSTQINTRGLATQNPTSTQIGMRPLQQQNFIPPLVSQRQVPTSTPSVTSTASIGPVNPRLPR